MNIADIRKVIRASAWVRNDFSGINAEFVRQPVRAILEQKIERLEALQIPARFVSDIADRTTEIGYCRNVIARWEAARADRTVTRSTQA